jgi:YVTN family beta-propeller protein
MIPRATPSKLRYLVAALAVVLTLSAGATLAIFHSAASDSPASPMSVYGFSTDVKAVPANPSTQAQAPILRGGSIPDGAGPRFGVVATVTLATASRPVGVASDNSTGNVFVSEAGSNKLVVISGSNQTVIREVVVGSNPAGVVFDSMYTEIFVANFYGNDVKVVSAVSYAVEDTIPISGNPVGLAYDSLNGNVYVTQQGANSTTEINGSTWAVMHSWTVGANPDAAAFDPSTADLFIANGGSANVTVLNTTTATVTGAIPAGRGADGVAYDCKNQDVYVTNFDSNNTTVISAVTQKAVTSLPVSPYPSGVAYDPERSVIAVAAEGPGQAAMADGEVNFISNATNLPVGNVTVGSDPDGIAFDFVNGYEYVANGHSDNVSVIGTPTVPPYPVTFSETGLASGTNWSVTLGGVREYSRTSSIVFSEVNGSYPYTVTPIPGYMLSSSAGSVLVDGFSVPVAVTFTAVVYDVVFSESGLAGGTLWSVTLNGSLGNSSSTTLTFSVGNGTYPYTVNSISSYTANRSSGNVIVNGGPQSVSIAFSTSSSSSSSPSSLLGIPYWVYIVIAIVVVGVVAIVLVLRRRQPPSTSPSPSGPSGTPGKPS